MNKSLKQRGLSNSTALEVILRKFLQTDRDKTQYEVTEEYLYISLENRKVELIMMTGRSVQMDDVCWCLALNFGQDISSTA